jgi:hypothetical protein
LGLEEVQPGYGIVTADYAFHYHLGPTATARLALPFEAYGYLYDEQVQPVKWFCGSRLDVTLGRREYILLFRDYRAWPWRVWVIPQQAPVAYHGNIERTEN